MDGTGEHDVKQYKPSSERKNSMFLLICGIYTEKKYNMT
jgi:hypothetical protein